MSPPKTNPPNFGAIPHVSESAILEKWNLFDKAAKKDLHWWFFALLMIGMLTVGFLYTDMRSERTSMRTEITEMRNSQLAYVTTKNEALMTALINNTRALEATLQTLNRIENRREQN